MQSKNLITARVKKDENSYEKSSKENKKGDLLNINETFLISWASSSIPFAFGYFSGRKIS